ncbi:hypothetical protein NQG36_10340 [Exiguobacterium aquaticum]|nr:hypothetical protein [Exiguobacterium aquaticum]
MNHLAFAGWFFGTFFIFERKVDYITFSRSTMLLLTSLIALGFACLMSIELLQGPFLDGWAWLMPAFFFAVSFSTFMRHLNNLEWNESK